MMSIYKPYPLFWYGFFCLFLPLSCAFAEDTQFSLEFYALKVNGQDMGAGQILHSVSGRYFARAEDFETWGVKRTGSSSLKYLSEDYFPLNDVMGFQAKFDEINQELALQFDPAAFKATVFSNPAENIVPNPAGSGGYINYDLYGINGGSAVLNQTQLNGQFELGAFNPKGAGFSSFLGQNLYINSKDPGSASRLIRLESNWVRDFPEEKQSLKFGDTTGRSGVWGRPIRFGGVQWGTNFATQPGFVTVPLPSFKGEATLPSTTEVFINGFRQNSLSVTPGPFQINNFPTISGAGEATVVVKDMLGREQVITQPFYLTPNLLRPSVDDYNIELGFIRNNFGIDNATYGRPMAVATQRKGFSEKLTGEWRGEILSDQQTAGLSAVYVPPLPVALTAAAVISNTRKGSGDFLLLGVDHQSFRGVNFGVRTQFGSKDFTQVGSGLTGQYKQVNATVGLYSRFGSFGLGYNYLKGTNPLRSETLTANYSKSVFNRASLTLSLYTSLVAPANQMAFIFLAYPMDNGIFASSSLSRQQGKLDTAVQIQKNPPMGSGIGYRAMKGDSSQGQRESVGVTLQTDYGSYILDAGRVPNQTTYRMTASGSVALMDGQALFSRRFYDSFVVAQVSGFPNVPVYLNGQLSSHTNRDGYAALPGLMSYQRNKVVIDTKDLPFEAQIERTEAEVIPRYHSGVLLKFSIELSVGALIKLVGENGKELPVGTLIQLDGSSEDFQVAMQGEVYVTGLAKKNKMKALWNKQSCDFEVNLPENSGPLPHIGPIVCHGIQP